MGEKMNQEKWFSLDEIKIIFPKFVRLFQSNWILLIHAIFTLLLCIFEIVFYFVNEQYRNRPISIYSRVFTPLITFVGVVVLFFSAQIFVKKCSERIEEIIDNLNIEFITGKSVANDTQKSIKKIRTGMALNLLLVPFVVLAIFIPITISSLIQKGTGFYYPSITISYFMISIKEIYYALNLFIFIYNTALVSLGIGYLQAFAESIDMNKLALKPTLKDKTGGFREIGKIIRNLSIVFIFVIFIQTIISIIEKAVQFIITESYTLIQEDVFEKDSPFEYIVLVFLTIILILFIVYFLYKGLKPFNKVITHYKNNKLKPLYKQRNNLINKTLEKDTQIKITNKNFNELQKYDYLIKEIEAIDNWPLSISRILIIFSSGLLPALITLVFKIIEIFVL